MVQPGQFLERPTLIPVRRELVLEGLSHRGARSPSLLILPPPAFEGSGMDHVVCAELAYAAARVGHQSLRFNYRGVGASQGEASRSVDDLLDDALAAYALARDNDEGRAPVVAALFAADALALELARRVTVAGLIFISPTLLVPSSFEERPAASSLVILPGSSFTDSLFEWRRVAQSGTFQLEILAETTRAFQRNLPQTGAIVRGFLARVE
jgi:alpha/beta superfamily hydrolase